MSQALTQAELFALLHTGHDLVLPHAHAARTLRARFAELPADASGSSQPGTVLAWAEWMSSLWTSLLNDGREERVLLNRAQEDQLWSDIIASHPSGGLHPTTSLVSQAQLTRSGLRLAAAYNATDRLRFEADTFDTRTFAAWVDAFRETCTRQRLLSPAFLEATLARHLRTGSLAGPESIHLVGFEEYTPAQQDLLTALRTSGTMLYQHAVLADGASGAHGLAVITKDPLEQLRFAVRWIGQQADEGAKTFALVTPRPEDHRPELERLMLHHLAPELGSVEADLSSTPWQFTTQPPLLSATVIAHAFHLLTWVGEAAPLERIRELLLSPYFAFSEALEARARFEGHTLRNQRLLLPELDLAQFLDLLTRIPRKTHGARFPELQALGRLTEKKNLLGGSRFHAEWADQLRALLAAVGWPGPRSLTASEFAAVEAWNNALDLLSTLDINGRRLSLPRFLQQLGEELQTTALAPPPTAAPVQILTLAQTEGIAFDRVLLLDATDRELPALGSPHPLISSRLAFLLGMPNVDATKTHTRVRQQIEHLRNRAGITHLVAPAADASGPLHLTRFAHDLGLHPAAPEAILPPETLEIPVTLTEITETGALPSLPSPTVGGGARVLELQAACGFRAFADIRLRAGEPEPLTLGLSAREAGTRLHDALYRLWQDLGSQARLRSLTMDARRAAVHEAVEQALRPLADFPGADRSWTRAFLSVVHDRFVRLLMAWLQLELKRSPFETVAQEEDQTVTVGPLQLKVRPDRIDQVESGLVYIDYKTKSSLSAEDWLGERPAAPQLPLYTLLAEPGKVRGLAFGRVRPGKHMGWIGLADAPGIFPEKKNSNHDLLAEAANWRTELTRLAEAFAAGQTEVDPKSYPQTCEFCGFRLLCRLNPEELLSQVSEEDPQLEEIDA